MARKWTCGWVIGKWWCCKEQKVDSKIGLRWVLASKHDARLGHHVFLS